MFNFFLNFFLSDFILFKRPIDNGLWLRCKLEMIKKGKIYELSLTDNGNFILSAFKRSRNTCSNYMIRLDKEFEQVKKDSGYIGKLKSNFFNSEYSIFDSGKNPKKTKIKEEYRKELGAVIYVMKIFYLFLLIYFFIDLYRIPLFLN